MNTCRRRNTKQRQFVLKELRASRSHPTVGELYEKVRQHMPNMSLGTVYRNLDILQETGQAIRLAGINGSEARYDGCTVPHLHFQCRDCGSLHDLEMNVASLDALIGQAPEGHIVAGYQVILHGTCQNCSRTGSN